jgi:hypothetical protein
MTSLRKNNQSKSKTKNKKELILQATLNNLNNLKSKEK